VATTDLLERPDRPLRRILELGGLMTADLRTCPDYLIIGGKRCGTTALQNYLTRHPHVLAPHSRKGTHYFDTNWVRGERWFRAHFPTQAARAMRMRAGGGPVVTGEASPYYCFHPDAPRRIAATLPDVRLIFLVRDPVERAFSHFDYERRRGQEPLSNIHDALDAESDRLAGEEQRLRADPAYVSEPHRHWSYQARGRYDHQLDAVFEHVDRDRVLVLDFRRFFADVDAQLQRVFAFLGLPACHVGPYERFEEGRGRSVPADVRDRLEPVFAPTVTRLRGDFDVDLC